MGLSLIGNASSLYWREVGAETFARRSPADPWTWIPFTNPREASEAVSPGVDDAVIEYDFGILRRPEYPSQFRPWFPWGLGGAMIAVVAYSNWNSELMFEGTLDVETIQLDNAIDMPSGVQQFRAYGHAHLLDRCAIHGAYTENGFIDTPLTFNMDRGSGAGLSGNMSPAEVYPPVFSWLGEVWTNAHIVQHIIAHFVNPFSPIQFVLVGEGMTALYNLRDVYNFEGMTPKQALDTLISRKDGVGWRVIATGENYAYIYVFSQLSVGAAWLVPPNQFQSDVVFAGSRMVAPEITFNDCARFDTIVVKGGPIYSCFTLSFADGTLMPGWTTTQETAYKAGSSDPEATAAEHDTERSSEKFGAVYQLFRIPASFLGFTGNGKGETANNAFPVCLLDSTLTAALQGNVFPVGKEFEDFLPLPEANSLDSDTAWRAPFAIVQIPDPNDSEELLYAFVHKLKPYQLAAADVEMAEGILAVRIEPEINHNAGLNHFDPNGIGTAPTGSPAQYDYETLIFTVFLKTDQHLKAELVANSGRTATGRTKFISVPDAEAHYVVPGTVIDITDGELVHHAGGWVRDDTARIRMKAELAAAWYGVPRATVKYTAEMISLAFPAGTMIRSVLGPEGITFAGTVVTRRRFVFTPGQQTTTVETGYEELDIEGMG